MNEGGRISRFFCRLNDGDKKRNEVVDDEDDDVSSSVYDLRLSHLASFEFEMCLLSKGVCWLN